MSRTQRAIVLFAHGSRDPQWSLPVQAVANQVRVRDPHVLVTCAYLEMMEPDLPGAARALVASGASHITVVPMFLGVGRHARQDLPRLMATLAQEHPQVLFDLQPAIGEDPRMVSLMAEIALS